MTIDKSAIRNAATVIVLRNRHDDPSILMGQRGAKAAFMPNKFVFPGGAVDAGDKAIRWPRPCPPCAMTAFAKRRLPTFNRRWLSPQSANCGKKPVLFWVRRAIGKATFLKTGSHLQPLATYRLLAHCNSCFEL